MNHWKTARSALTREVVSLGIILAVAVTLQRITHHLFTGTADHGR